MYVYVCTYVCMCVCVCVYACMYVCMYVCMDAYRYACICLHACMPACMQVCKYICQWPFINDRSGIHAKCAVRHWKIVFFGPVYSAWDCVLFMVWKSPLPGGSDIFLVVDQVWAPPRAMLGAQPGRRGRVCGCVRSISSTDRVCPLSVARSAGMLLHAQVWHKGSYQVFFVLCLLLFLSNERESEPG